MLKQVVACVIVATLSGGAVEAQQDLRQLVCKVQDEARLTRNGSLSKEDAGWFIGYEFTVDLTSGTVGFAGARPETWRIVERGGDMTDYVLAPGGEGPSLDTIRIRAWFIPPGPAPILFFRTRLTRAYSGTCLPVP